MSITIAVNIDNGIGEDTVKSLQIFHGQENIKFAFVTEKRRYELPLQLLDIADSLNAILAKESQSLEGIVFALSGDEILHDLAADYIKNFYTYNPVNITLPQQLRERIVTKCHSVKHLQTRFKYMVSCIIPVYNAEKYLHEAIDSVVNQTIGFEKNIQLLLVNDGSGDGSGKICEEYAKEYPNNVVYIEQENAGVSAARNVGLDVAAGEFIAFLDSDDLMDTDYIQKGIEQFNKYGEQIDIVSYPLKFFGAKEGRIHPLEYVYTATQLVSVGDKKYSNYIKANAASALIRYSAIGGLRFDSSMKYAEDGYFITQILKNTWQYAVLSDTCYNYRKSWEGGSALDNSVSSVGWYEKLFLYCGRLIDNELEQHGFVNTYIQSLVMYDLQWYKVHDIPESIKEQVSIGDLFKELKRILAHISDDVIRAQKFISYWQKVYLLELKHGEEKLLMLSANPPEFYIGGVKREGVTPSVWISIVEEYDGLITIAGSYTVLNNDEIELIAVHNDELYTCTFHNVSYRSEYFLGEVCYKASVFDIKIPFTEKGDVFFYAKVAGFGIFPVRLSFSYGCRMCNKLGSFVLGDQSLISRQGVSSLRVEHLSEAGLRQNIETYIKQNFSNVFFKEDVSLVQVYLDMYKIMSKRRIWLFMDRPDKADDNAEHLFRYCANIDDGVDKYFVLREDSADVERIKNIGNVIFFGSNQHKLFHLFAEKYIASSFDYPYIFPFGSDERIELFQGISKAKFIFLQHGIIKDDMSKVLCKWVRNAKMFVTSSKYEYNSILCSEYGYNSDIVRLVGLPRFDALKNETKKQILFIFTWRKELRKFTSGQNEGNVYNENFRNSLYFKRISELLTDKRLLDAAKNYGYDLIFRPHPSCVVQLKDFSFNNAVTVASNEVSYQKLYAESAIAVTDYSSAIFDFAYLRKPVVYYQFDENNWDKGYFNYETMGFGSVLAEKDHVVDALIRYMDTNCIMENTYRKRADDFFAFDDKSNCERAYTHIYSV